MFEPVNIGLLYLFPVLTSALLFGLWPSVYAACMGVLAFDFFFIPPIYSYTVSDLRYLISLAVLLAVGAITAVLASTLKKQAEGAIRRERMTSALLAMSRQMAEAPDLDTMMTYVVRHVSATLMMPASVVLADGDDDLSLSFGDPVPASPSRPGEGVLSWVYHHGEPATFGEKSLPELVCLPLKTEDEVHGVLCVGRYGEGYTITPESLRLIEAFSRLAAVSVAHWKLQEQAKIAHLSAESERLRTALLDSISHELRTPLTTILGAAASIADNHDRLDPADEKELLTTLRESALRMNRLVLNLLSMVRIESGMVLLRHNVCDVSEIVGMAVHQLSETLSTRPVSVNIPDDLAVTGDQWWLQHVIVNLLSNAAKYSPPNGAIDIAAEYHEGAVLIHIKDVGHGIARAEQERVFEKFYRGENARHIPGTGLGLAICKSIVEAHHGTITAVSNVPRGTVITVSLPPSAAESESAFEELKWTERF